MSKESGVAKVLEAADGSASKAAARLSTDDRPCSRQNVEYWIKQGYVPGTWAPRVAEVFDVPLHELNPRVYPAASRRRH
jgi:hypothetical protein